MTCINLTFGDMYGAVLTDTLQYRGRQPHSFAGAKTRIVDGEPGFVYATSGSAFAGWRLQPWLLGLTSIDDVAGTAEAEFVALERTEHDADSGIKLVAMGWSPARNRVSAIRVERAPWDAPVKVESLEPGTYCQPDPQHPLPDLLTEEQMVKLALVQQKIADKYRLKMCIGGDMHMTEVRRTGMSHRIVGEYPNKRSLVRRGLRVIKEPLHPAMPDGADVVAA